MLKLLLQIVACLIFVGYMGVLVAFTFLADQVWLHVVVLLSIPLFTLMLASWFLAAWYLDHKVDALKQEGGK